MKNKVKRKAAFFDRDGTINVDVGYLHRAEDLEFMKGIPNLIRDYNEKGYLVIVITNQSGIARGIYSIEEMEHLHEVMNKRLQVEYGAHIDDFYYCPHLPEISGECDCRKPKPGMYIQAIDDYNIDVSHSISYGDSKRDEEASLMAGITNFVYII